MLYSPFSDAMVQALERESVIICMACEIDFESGTTRVHSGAGELVLSGYVYLGVGSLGKCGSVSEASDISPSQMNLSLSGLDTALLTQTLNEPCVDRPVRTYLVAIADDGNPLAIDLLHEGFISSSSAVAGKTCGISYTVSNIFEKWQEGRSDRFTDESQRALYQDDRFFRYVAQMSERSIYWGSKKDAPPFNYA
ncbi:hypothetical protein LVQ77_16965 [Buttiauxella sp. S04-F03]|uniref:hypothetical protein n=1 Tax=Buttiauxella sp. W03-F01 TaxID=2904524 RepID=UPI001E48FD3F|nr:hypothetical protein [Buttiauxella sp. W03-F01]MCE0801977.1 hypothetical protein [Buttiauxella sp. W03-F01]